MLVEAGNVLLIGAFGLTLLFLAHYLYGIRWVTARRSLTSWYLLGSNLMWALILGLGTATILVGHDFPARDAIRVGVYALIVAKLATQYVLLIDSRRHPREEGGQDGRDSDSGAPVRPQ